MGEARCHCCGGVPDIHDTSPRYCHTCRTGCRLVAKATILRAEGCPFLKGRKPPVLAPSSYGPPLDRPEVENAPVRETVRTGALATGLPAGTDFVWRGRARRNVPGG